MIRTNCFLSRTIPHIDGSVIPSQPPTEDMDARFLLDLPPYTASGSNSEFDTPQPQTTQGTHDAMVGGRFDPQDMPPQRPEASIEDRFVRALANLRCAQTRLVESVSNPRLSSDARQQLRVETTEALALYQEVSLRYRGPTVAASRHPIAAEIQRQYPEPDIDQSLVLAPPVLRARQHDTNPRRITSTSLSGHDTSYGYSTADDRNRGYASYQRPTHGSTEQCKTCGIGLWRLNAEQKSYLECGHWRCNLCLNRPWLRGPCC